MKAMIKLLSAVISGTVMAFSLVGGMESLGIGSTREISVSAAKAEKAYDGTAYITVGKNIKCKSGEEVSVPIKMSLDKLASPRSIYKICFKVSYDESALTLTGVERGGGLSGGMCGRSGDTVMFIGLKGNMRVSAGKPVCELKFKVKDDADGTYPIKLLSQSGGNSQSIQIVHTHSSKKGNIYLTSGVTSGSVVVGDAPELGEITGFTADKSGAVSWDPLPNAAYYRVTRVVNGKAYPSGKITETSYTMSVPESDFSVYVTAYDSKGRSVDSESVMIYNAKHLGRPTNVSVDSSGVVTWDAAENASYYTVTKVSNGVSSTTPAVKETSYVLSSVPKTDYEVYVMSYDSRGYFLVSDICKVKQSASSEEVDTPMTTEITGLKADKNGNVTWDAVEGAASYTVTKVYKGTETSSKKITSASYKFVKVPEGDFEVYVTAYFKDGQTIVSPKVKVKLNGEDKPAEPSEPDGPEEPADTEKLGEISEVGVNDEGSITWNSVDNAVCYTVTVKWNGEETTSDKLTATSYVPDPKPDSDYVVIITAYDAENNSVQSDETDISVE